VTKRPGSRVFIHPGSLPGRLFRCLKRSIASLVRLGNHASKRCYTQPRALDQALPPGPVLGQAHRYHVLFLPRLPTSTWSATTLNLCLRESLDSAAIQLTPSLPSYTTHSYYFVMCSCPDNKSHVPIWLTPLLQYSCHRSKLG